MVDRVSKVVTWESMWVVEIRWIGYSGPFCLRLCSAASRSGVRDTGGRDGLERLRVSVMGAPPSLLEISV